MPFLAGGPTDIAARILAERLAQAGGDPAAPATPAETRGFLAAEVATFRGIVRAAGVKPGR